MNEIDRLFHTISQEGPKNFEEITNVALELLDLIFLETPLKQNDLVKVTQVFLSKFEPSKPILLKILDLIDAIPEEVNKRKVLIEMVPSVYGGHPRETQWILNSFVQAMDEDRVLCLPILGAIQELELTQDQKFLVFDYTKDALKYADLDDIPTLIKTLLTSYADAMSAVTRLREIMLEMKQIHHIIPVVMKEILVPRLRVDNALYHQYVILISGLYELSYFDILCALEILDIDESKILKILEKKRLRFRFSEELFLETIQTYHDIIPLKALESFVHDMILNQYWTSSIVYIFKHFPNLRNSLQVSFRSLLSSETYAVTCLQIFLQIADDPRSLNLYITMLEDCLHRGKMYNSVEIIHAFCSLLCKLLPNQRLLQGMLIFVRKMVFSADSKRKIIGIVCLTHIIRAGERIGGQVHQLVEMCCESVGNQHISNLSKRRLIELSFLLDLLNEQEATMSRYSKGENSFSNQFQSPSKEFIEKFTISSPLFELRSNDKQYFSDNGSRYCFLISPFFSKDMEKWEPLFDVISGYLRLFIGVHPEKLIDFCIFPFENGTSPFFIFVMYVYSITLCRCASMNGLFAQDWKWLRIGCLTLYCKHLLCTESLPHLASIRTKVFQKHFLHHTLLNSMIKMIYQSNWKEFVGIAEDLNMEKYFLEKILLEETLQALNPRHTEELISEANTFRFNLIDHCLEKFCLESEKNNRLEHLAVKSDCCRILLNVLGRKMENDSNIEKIHLVPLLYQILELTIEPLTSSLPLATSERIIEAFLSHFDNSQNLRNEVPIRQICCIYQLTKRTQYECFSGFMSLQLLCREHMFTLNSLPQVFQSLTIDIDHLNQDLYRLVNLISGKADHPVSVSFFMMGYTLSWTTMMKFLSNIIGCLSHFVFGVQTYIPVYAGLNNESMEIILLNVIAMMCACIEKCHLSAQNNFQSLLEVMKLILTLMPLWIKVWEINEDDHQINGAEFHRMIRLFLSNLSSKLSDCFSFGYSSQTYKRFFSLGQEIHGYFESFYNKFQTSNQHWAPIFERIHIYQLFLRKKCQDFHMDLPIEQHNQEKWKYTHPKLPSHEELLSWLRMDRLIAHVSTKQALEDEGLLQLPKSEYYYFSSEDEEEPMPPQQQEEDPESMSDDEWVQEEDTTNAFI